MAPGTWKAPEENYTVASASAVAYCSRAQIALTCFSKCHRSDIHVPALLEPSRPITLGVHFFVDDAQIRAGAMHQERPQVAIALASD